VLGKILESNEKEVKVHILQNFSDLDLEIDIIIDDFYLLNMVKSSGAKPYFKLKKDSYYYFFLKKNSNGNYSLPRSEEHTSELQSRENLVCRLLLEKKKKKT